MHYEKFRSEFDQSDCRKFKARLDAVLDAREDIDDDAELRAHALSCPSCAQWMQAQAIVLTAVKETIPVVPAVSLVPQHDFALRILQAVDVERKHEKRWQRWRIASLAIAGGLLIAVLNWRFPDVGASLTTSPNHPTATGSASMRQLADFAGDLSTKQLALVGNMAEGFKPVTSSVNAALQTLLRTVPVNAVPLPVL